MSINSILLFSHKKLRIAIDSDNNINKSMFPISAKLKHCVIFLIFVSTTYLMPLSKGDNTAVYEIEHAFSIYDKVCQQKF